MTIKISSESTCDLSAELIRTHDISIMPATIIMEGHTYQDGVSIHPKDIFAHTEETGNLCTTSALNVGEFQEYFATLSRQHEAIVHICIGSGFSSGYQNACIAAQDFPNVHVIDSQSLSTGQGLVVLAACKLAKGCEDVSAMCAALRDMTGRIEASFILERLDYMVKGGRCSSVMALGANLMQLKPCIEVIDGKLQSGKKYRGPYAKCAAAYIRERLAGRTDLEMDTLFFTYTELSDESLAAATQVLDELGGSFAQVYITQAGCSVSCHCGPGTMGVLFVRKKS